MANLVVAIFAVAIILAAMAGASSGLIGPQDTLAGSLKELEVRRGDAERTVMTYLDLSVSDNGNGTSTIDFEFRNDGQSSLLGWPDWDAFVSFESGSPALNVQRLTYTTAASPAAGEWTVEGIYKSQLLSTAEEYEPGIVNTTEAVRVRAVVSPAVGSSTENSFTLTTPTGVSISAPFSN